MNPAIAPGRLVLPFFRRGARCLASISGGDARVTTSTSSSQAPSKRAQFRLVQPERRALEHLDALKLGFCAKRRMRVAVARRMGDNEAKQLQISTPVQKIPYPFTEVGRPLYTAEAFEELRPKSGLIPEVAIIGRSNVGKSTLVNAILGYDSSFLQRAFVSPKPGATNQLHFYGLGRTKIVRDSASSSSVSSSLSSPPINKQQILRSSSMPPALVVVDMPGYGFAYLNEQEKLRCETLTYRYLIERGPSLKRVLLLLDARHGFKLIDKNFFQGLLTARNDVDEQQRQGGTNTTTKTKIRWQLQLVLTKCDLIERMELARRMVVVQQQVTEMLPGLNVALSVIPVSGKESKGVTHIQKNLASLVAPSEAN